MKKFNRLLSLILAILMVSALFTFSLPVSAATGEGLTFSSDVLYAPEGSFNEVANTFEAWIKIPKSERTKRSYILSSSWTGNRFFMSIRWK